MKLLKLRMVNEIVLPTLGKIPPFSHGKIHQFCSRFCSWTAAHVAVRPLVDKSRIFFLSKRNGGFTGESPKCLVYRGKQDLNGWFRSTHSFQETSKCEKVWVSAVKIWQRCVKIGTENSEDVEKLGQIRFGDFWISGVKIYNLVVGILYPLALQFFGCVL